MPIKKLLIANRGEIAIRIAAAAAELGMISVAVYSEDDAAALHRQRADEALALSGEGVPAYLDMGQMLALAERSGCDAIHPGYGFLSENPEFADRCEAAGLIFVGPTAKTLARLGDKAEARASAAQAGLPLLPGTRSATSLEQAGKFFDQLEPGASLIIKALAGGGGRGMRRVNRREDLEAAYERCRSEARAAFGQDAVYVEQYLPHARHVEVQLVGDGEGNVAHLWERECSIQRRHQKLVEVAPAPTLDPNLREQLLADAVRLGEALNYRGLGTVEFLVDIEHQTYTFMEANPRLQVEHTVTEAVTGIDLVQTQLQLAAGATLAALGLEQASIPRPRGHAIQMRINQERLRPDGQVTPTSGIVEALDLPTGPGIRIDSAAFTGCIANPRFDTLLAKLIVHSPSPDYHQAVTRARRALRDCHITGIETNLAVLRSLLALPAFADNDVDTGFFERHCAALAPDTPSEAGQAPIEVPANVEAAVAPMAGVVVSVDVEPGARVTAGQSLAVLEAMKMEHLVTAPCAGQVREVRIRRRDQVNEGAPLILIEPADEAGEQSASAEAVDPDWIRPDLAEVLARQQRLQDEARPEAVARRRKTGQHTARENIAALCDGDSFIEYGGLAVAAQRRRKSLDHLVEASPADGLITGIGSVNGDQFGEDRARCMVMAYDYTVMAGTQGLMNHQKLDRMLGLAHQWQLPLVLFAEGGGGRPNDTDIPMVGGLHLPSFAAFARLSGAQPTVGIASGRCFAGNAALLGCCDVIIATEDANIGMGGPAMIEGGGLGVFPPEAVGPIEVQTRNGVVDIRAGDEAEAVGLARQYLSYFQGCTNHWQSEDPRRLRHLVPENRRRAYDMRAVIKGMADTDSVLELRPDFGVGLITALVRIEGRPLGLMANNPFHLGGAIDADAADKGARFMQLCDAYDLPILSLCDTPGFMVGPEVEKTAQVRHVSRLFVTAASLSVPFLTVVLRKGYGLGAMSMAGGSFHAPFFTVAWPTGEFGGMGLEGAVRLGFRRELEAIDDPEKREARFQQLVEFAYERGKALNTASMLEIDNVIDPADTRTWISRGLRSLPPVPPRSGKKRPCIDTW